MTRTGALRTADDRNFDAAVDWLLNHGSVDFEMRDRFRAISTGLVSSERIDDYGHEEIRRMLVDAGEISA